MLALNLTLNKNVASMPVISFLSLYCLPLFLLLAAFDSPELISVTSCSITDASNLSPAYMFH